MQTGSRAAAPAAGRLLSFPRLLAFSGAGLPSAALLLVVAVYLPHFFVGHIGLSLAAVGGAFSIVRLFDIALDPIVASVMDRSRTKIGRYRPWFVLSAPAIMAASYMLFMAQPGVGALYLIGWLIVLYAGMSMLILSQAAWGATLATDYNERSRVYGVLQGVSVLGTILVLILPIMLGGHGAKGQAGGVQVMGWFILIVTPLTVALAALATPEPAIKPRTGQRFGAREYWAMINRPEMRRIIFADLIISLGPGTTAALYLFFFHDARGYTTAQTDLLLVFYIFAQLLGSPFWGWFGTRIGKHRALMVSAVAYALSQSALMMIPKATMALAIPGMFTVGFVASAFIPLIRAMVADVSDAVRLELGQDRTSLLYAMVTTTQKIGVAVTVGVSFAVLAKVGFKPAEGAVNTAGAIHGLEACYVFVPVVFALIGGAAFFGYKLDARRHGEIRQALDARDALAMVEPSATEGLTGASDVAARAPIADPVRAHG